MSKRMADKLAKTKYDAITRDCVLEVLKLEEFKTGKPRFSLAPVLGLRKLISSLNLGDMIQQNMSSDLEKVKKRHVDTINDFINKELRRVLNKFHVGIVDSETVCHADF